MNAAIPRTRKTITRTQMRPIPHIMRNADGVVDRILAMRDPIDLDDWVSMSARIVATLWTRHRQLSMHSKAASACSRSIVSEESIFSADRAHH
jgi:hypothetical protein